MPRIGRSQAGGTGGKPPEVERALIFERINGLRHGRILPIVRGSQAG